MVDAIPEEAGTAWVMIYDRETDFINAEAEPLASASIAPGSSRGTVDFSALNSNEFYAVAVFFDHNGNQQLDRSRSGRPAESYAFSEMGRYTGVPTFSDAAFQLRPGTSAILLTMNKVRYKGASPAKSEPANPASENGEPVAGRE
jgi:uncharacterized protein (DUF2141 family)